MKKLLSAGLCLSMFLLAGCQGQPQDTTLTITDQAGREVTFEEPCQTAASGYYITTTIMIGLQQQDKLTGIEMKPETRPIYAKAAEEILDLPQLGNKKMFNVEECAKADPDVVFLPVSLESYVEELETLDIPVVLLEPETADDFEEAVEIIGKVMGCEDKVDEYKQYEEDLLEKYELDEVEEEPTVYFAGSDLLTCATDDMYQGEILSYAQADNAIDAEGSSWVNIDIETLLAANPDYVFIEAGSLSADDFKNDARVQELQAVQNDHVYVFPSTLETWDTPSLSSCLGKLWAASILHPELVSMDDVKAESVAFYEQFYGFTPEAQDLAL